jgi:thiol-disulfide isomerase/thioredoxin
MKKQYVFFGIIIAAVLAAAFWLSFKSRSGRGLETVQKELAPAEKIFAAEFLDFNGNVVKLADLGGRPLAINAWATWCLFCEDELKGFVEVQQELGEDAIIVAVNRQEPRLTAIQYIEDLGISNRIVVLLDPADAFYTAIEGFSMPETVFMDADGNILDHKRGPMDANEIRKRFQSALQSR